MSNSLNIKSILEIILKATKKNANILANTYLLKDESIVSKWKRNIITPKSDDIDKILEFVYKESTQSQRKIIRDELEELIENSSISEDFKQIILGNEDFGQFLKEVISVSISDNNVIRKKDVLSVAADTISDKSHFSNNFGEGKTYSGTMQFNLVMPENGDVMFSGATNKSDIEITGDVNLSSKSKITNVTRLFRRKSVLGIILLWATVGTVSITALNLSERDVIVLDSKVYESNKEQSAVPSNVLCTPIATPTIPVTPTTNVLPTNTQPSKTNSIVVDKNKNRENKKSSSKINNNVKQNYYSNIIVNNNIQNNTVSINGNGTTIIQGEDLAVSIDKN